MADHQCTPFCDCKRTDFVVNEDEVLRLASDTVGVELPRLSVKWEAAPSGNGYSNCDAVLALHTDIDTGTDVIDIEILLREGLDAGRAVAALLHEIEHIRQYLHTNLDINAQRRVHTEWEEKWGYSSAPHEVAAVKAEIHWPSYGWLITAADQEVPDPVARVHAADAPPD